jgi:hypothetical protein
MSPALFFLIGASGVGKTAVTKKLEARAIPWIRCYYFDSIGVPTIEIMERDFGSGEKWQAMATAQWVERLVENNDNATIALLEGQTRPSFIQPALERADVRHARVVLLDCDTEVRAARLGGLRGQPHLVTATMDNWAAYLRGQADALGLPVIDTSRKALAAVADEIQTHLEGLRSEVS